MVTAIGTKLASGRQTAQWEDAIGGSTYTFDVWPGHPHRDEVLSFLEHVREHGRALRQKVEAYAAVASPRERELERVIASVGQTVLGGTRAGAESELEAAPLVTAREPSSEP